MLRGATLTPVVAEDGAGRPALAGHVYTAATMSSPCSMRSCRKERLPMRLTRGAPRSGAMEIRDEQEKGS